MPKKYLNREISWLHFNARVLQEAADPSVPLLERIKFLGIYSSNMDEFFSVRVGTLKRMMQAGIKSKSIFGGSPRQILKKVQEEVLKQRDDYDILFNELIEELKKENILIIDENELVPAQKKFVLNYFQEEVRPRLVPIMPKSLDEFPYIKNQVIYLAIDMVQDDEPAEKNFALIELPVGILSRFLVLPKHENKTYIIILDDVIRFGLKEIFHIFKFDAINAYTIKLTRDAELDIHDDITQSLFEKISKSIKHRKKGQPVRFVYDQTMPKYLLNYILSNLNIQNFENLIPGSRYHNARDFMNFPKVGSSNLRFKKLKTVNHPDIKPFSSIFEAVKKKDILVHYPYQSFNNMIDLLREAAIDPKVTSIKITLYRVARKSSIINSLINASKNGKDVTVVMELQARFDEEANIYWMRKLGDEDIKLIDGVPGLKVHAKICLISRKEGQKTMQYATIGTGNFNETTARLYGDHTLMTASKEITREVQQVFKFLENNYKNYNYKHLLVSPFTMRKKIVKCINTEIKNAQAGKTAFIHAKLNSLVDQQIINKLYEASQAGVQIKLIVRGICSLIPQLEGISENIKVISILDRYLEHSRIFVFCNDNKEKYYISSADWMIRNLDNRVEVATPILSPDVKKQLRKYFDLQWEDEKKARWITPRHENIYKSERQNGNKCAQEELYQYIRNFNEIE